MRALIVDDSRFVRGFLRGLLQEKGIECEEAADGQAASEFQIERWRRILFRPVFRVAFAMEAHFPLPSAALTDPLAVNLFLLTHHCR